MRHDLFELLGKALMTEEPPEGSDAAVPHQ
jgi:hypothetical protein